MRLRFGNLYRRSAVGLTIGNGSINMVRLTVSRSRPVVERAITRPIPEPRGETEIVGALRELIAQERIRSRELNIAVPRNEITTRIITLPSASEIEIHKMVQLEVEEFVPYSADELEVDETTMEQLPEGSSKVLVAVAHRDVVEKPFSLLAKAGIEPAHIGVSCFAMYNAFMCGAGSLLTGSVALLDVSDVGTDILVSDSGRLSFTRGVPHLRADSATTGEIAEELKNSLNAYSRETGGATVERVLLSGEIEKLDEVAKTLADTLGIRVEEAGFVAQACDIEGTGARYAIQVGLALSAFQKPILDVDLVPRRIRERKERDEKRRAWLVVTALGALVLLLAYLLANSKLADKRSYIRFLNEQIARMERPAKVVREKKARVDAISAQLSRKNSALEVMWKIHGLAPEKLVLDGIDFVRAKDLLIRGKCYDRMLAFDFARRLRNSGIEALANAEVGDTRNEKLLGKPVIRFEIRSPMTAAELGAVQGENLPVERFE